jgi:hypothetical protein
MTSAHPSGQTKRTLWLQILRKVMDTGMAQSVSGLSFKPHLDTGPNATPKQAESST